MRLTAITNTPQPYAWGRPGGVARALGQPGTDAPEAELWLGAHPLCPSRVLDPAAPWPDLLAWERHTDTTLPYLMKLLAAQRPLSLQAHPTTDQASAGFAREEAAGIPRDANHRNYKDPHAKPELIVAIEDGFSALCGFRDIAQTIAEIDTFAHCAPDPAWQQWRERLTGPEGIRSAFVWLLSDAPEVTRLITLLAEAASQDPGRFPLATLLAAEYPGDPGIAVAHMLNQVVLQSGEALWLPAGNVHAYLSGLGVEVMGPSDNVLRGGLTPKHVDPAELVQVLDFSAGPASHLPAVPQGQHAVAYTPASVASGAGVPFELVLIDGPTRLHTGSAAVALVLNGDFRITGVDQAPHALSQGDAAFMDAPGPVTVTGSGRLALAHARP
ncbi:MAG: mannose-6-phosphate isomerase, class I [Propioniciclava sp.]